MHKMEELKIICPIAADRYITNLIKNILNRVCVQTSLIAVLSVHCTCTTTVKHVYYSVNAPFRGLPEFRNVFTAMQMNRIHITWNLTE